MDFYENLYAETERWRPQLEMVNCPIINAENKSMLEAPFELQEILESIKPSYGDKAPCPDGYSMAFFKRYWDVINSDLVGVIQNFHDQFFFEKKLNETFVSLIPKKVDA